MNIEEYSRMFHLEENYWWFKGRREVVFRMLQSQTAGHQGAPLRVFDLGCGTGKALMDLQAMGHQVTGLDFSGEALAFSHQRGGQRLVRGDAASLPFADASFDVIIALDIMEHVEDGASMAREMMRVLAPGGIAIINVPAHPFLWSGHDVALHHFRRYTRRGFQSVLDAAQFQLVRYSYSICLLFFPALMYRLLYNLIGAISRRPPQSHVISTGNLLNRLFFAIIALEARLMEYVNLPIGLSLLAVARKN